MNAILAVNFFHKGRWYKVERAGELTEVSFGLALIVSFKDGHHGSPLEAAAQESIDVFDPILIESD